MMLKVMSAAMLVSAMFTNPAAAQANPGVPMTVIEDTAVQMCGALNADPTPDGVVEGMQLVYDRGLDDMDAALVTMVAVHHACPQHEQLIFGVLDPLAAEDLCTERF